MSAQFSITTRKGADLERPGGSLPTALETTTKVPTGTGASITGAFATLHQRSEKHRPAGTWLLSHFRKGDSNNVPSRCRPLVADISILGAYANICPRPDRRRPG